MAFSFIRTTLRSFDYLGKSDEGGSLSHRDSIGRATSRATRNLIERHNRDATEEFRKLVN
jgi:hypothetical protein